MSFNSVGMIGRLTKDPELHTTTHGKSIATMVIAVKKRLKPLEGKDCDFFRIKAFGQHAEFASQYLQKGRLVCVQGRLENRQWTDSNGVERETAEIICEYFEALDRPRGEIPSESSTEEPVEEQ